MSKPSDYVRPPRRIPEQASFSQLWMLGVCPRKFAYKYVNREPDHLSQAALFGMGLDTAFERLYREARERAVPSLDDLVAAFVMRAPEVRGRAGDARALLREYIEKDHLALRDPEHALIQAHTSVILRPVGTRIRGYIDLLHGIRRRRPPVVADLKCPAKVPTPSTLKKRADDSIQLSLYAAGTGTERAEIIAMGVRPTTRLRKEPEAVVIHQSTQVTPERLDRHAIYIQDLERTLKRCVSSNEWPRREPGGLCNQCSFAKQCWEEDKPILPVAPDGTIIEV